MLLSLCVFKAKYSCIFCVAFFIPELEAEAPGIVSQPRGWETVKEQKKCMSQKWVNSIQVNSLDSVALFFSIRKLLTVRSESVKS
jgi:hypothetical protein